MQISSLELQKAPESTRYPWPPGHWPQKGQPGSPSVASSSVHLGSSHLLDKAYVSCIRLKRFYLQLHRIAIWEIG